MRRPGAQQRPGLALIAAAVSAAALCTACGHSAPTEFLTLRAVPPAAPPASAGVDPVRVVAVRVPAWLDRLQIARPTEGAAVVVEDFERWSAPLGDLALAALTQDLTDRLAGTTVLAAGGIAPPGTRDVAVDLSTLERQGGRLELSGTATVTDAGTGALVLSPPVRLGAAAPADARSEAAALDQLMGELADRLASALSAPSTSRGRQAEAPRQGWQAGGEETDGSG
jgi:uncharacterized lipoprotein YmbA